MAFVSPHAPDAAALVTAAGVPAYSAPESVAVGLSALRSAFAIRSLQRNAAPVCKAPPSLPAGTLDEAASKALFAHFGIVGARERIVGTTREAEAAAREFNDRVVLPGYEAINFYGLVAPKGTPAEIIDTLNKSLNAGLADADLTKRFETLGVVPQVTTPAEFGAPIAAETEKWDKVVTLAGLKPN